MAEADNQLTADSVALSNVEDDVELSTHELATDALVEPPAPIDTVLVWHAIKLTIALILLPLILFRCM